MTNGPTRLTMKWGEKKEKKFFDVVLLFFLHICYFPVLVFKMTDYKKWDKFVDDEETEVSKPPTYTPAQRAAAEAEASRARASAPVDDSRSEIDKLKAARRLAREAAADSASPMAASTASAAPASCSNEAARPEAPTDPVSRIIGAEASLAALRDEAAAVRLALAAAVHADEVIALVTRVVAAQGSVGALQAAIDEISVGELEDEAVQDDARARRKVLNRSIDDELVPTWTTIRTDVLAAKKRFGA